MDTTILREIPLFASLPEQEIVWLAELLQENQRQPGEILIEEGGAGECFYVVLDGEVDIIKSIGTVDERLIGVRGKGTMLGEMSMFSRDRRHSATVRARSPLRLLQMTSAQFDELLHHYPDLAYEMVRTFSLRLQDSENAVIADLREKNRQLSQAYEALKAAQAAMIEKERMERELEIAGEIQRSILPEALPSHPGMEFGALMVPARTIGGDFYDFIPLGRQRLGVVVGDVCDKGIPAALFMGLTYSSVRTEAFRHKSPGETLRAVNRHLLQVNRSGLYVTLLYGILDFASGEFRYARAGHPEPLVLDRDLQAVSVTVGRGQPVGLFSSPAMDEQTIPLQPGGTIILYSDGLSETVEAQPDAPSLDGLCQSVVAGGAHTVQQLCHGLWSALGAHAADTLIQDDFTVVGLRSLAEGAGQA